MDGAFWGDFSVGTRGRLDEDCRTLLERAAASPLPPLSALEPAEARAQFRRTAKRSNPPIVAARVRDAVIDTAHGPLAVRLYGPEAPAPAPALLFLHGGGFVLGDLDTHDPICRILAAGTGALVVAADYRLAPENGHPAALEDAWAALAWMRQEADRLGSDRERIAVGGDSAGGNIAAVTALRARDEGVGLALQILIYPATDEAGDTPSRRDFGKGYLLTAEDIDWFGRHRGAPLLTPDASPLRAASHAGLAPALIYTAGFDPLRDEGAAYADRLRAAGVPVRHLRFEGTIHGCLNLGGYIAAGRDMLDRIVADWRRAQA